MKHICRICLNEVPALNFVAREKDESSQIKMQLSLCVPEMIVDLVKDPVYCKSCVSALQFAYNFKNRCLRTEEHIHNYSLKILSSKNIDIQDILYDLQQSTTNGEDENGRIEGFTVTPNMNLMLLDEDLVNVQNLSAESNRGQYSVTLPTDAGYKINNANNVTANCVSKPAIETTADELKRLVDARIGVTPIQSLEFKQEAENQSEDVIIKEEDIAVLKVESSLSYEGFGDDLFEDINSENHTADVKSMDNKNAILQSNIVAQNCFVKLTKLPDDIPYENNILLEDVLRNTPNHALVVVNQVENVKRDIKVEEDNRTKHKQKHLLKSQLRIHTGEKPFTCNVCARRFAQKSHLQDHLRVHTGERPFACNMCNLRFSHKSSLHQHLRVHTGEKRFTCNVCTYRSTDKAHLRDHLRIHTGEKPFTCTVCAFRSARKYNLQKHLRIHTGEKPFSCNVCARRFAQKSHLQDHLRVHTGERPFACNMCNLRFSQKSSLHQHLRVHTGEKPFACNVCTYRSTDKAHLRDHLRIHTGEKPFCCHVCTYRYSHKSSLLKHLRNHTGEKP